MYVASAVGGERKNGSKFLKIVILILKNYISHTKALSIK